MEKQKGFHTITASELNNRLAEGERIILINTLRQEQFEKKHIPNSQNACVFEVTFPEQVAAIVADKNREVVLYGSSDKSKDAVTAAEKLTRLGYGNVFALTGGIKSWKEAGYPLEGNETEALDDSEAEFRLEDGVYSVDVEKSSIEWTGRNPNTTHYGTVQMAKGEVRVEGGNVGGIFIVDMNSIKNINLEGDEMQPILIDHLKSDDFFFVKLFPQATLRLKAAKPLHNYTFSAPNFHIEGTLDLCGMSKNFEFLATVNKTDGGEIVAEAHFDIDRTRWNVIYGSSRFFEHLDMHLVFDPISFQLRIIARKT
jgi:polyisoprenoid-binding protein YceI/rhodanese-related sulfurtransferase